MYTHAPTAEIQNNPLACSPQSDSCVCLLSAPALQTQMSKPMQKSQQNGTVSLPSAHCFTTMYRQKTTLQAKLTRRRVTARLVTVQASNAEAFWMITSTMRHFQPSTHTFSQCTCWGTATLHSLADCSEAAARSLCGREAFQMQIHTSIRHSMRTGDRELSDLISTACQARTVKTIVVYSYKNGTSKWDWMSERCFWNSCLQHELAQWNTSRWDNGHVQNGILVYICRKKHEAMINVSRNGVRHCCHVMFHV